MNTRCLIGVTTIATCAIRACQMVQITVPIGVTHIGRGAFEDCGNLKSISLPEGLTVLEDNLFCHCSNLENLVIPESVTSIGGVGGSKPLPTGSVFLMCEKLTAIKLPKNLTHLSAYAFQGSSITSIVLPGKIEKVPDGAFRCCFETLSLQKSLFLTESKQ